MDKTKKDATHVFLDPSHSHFILVDDSVSNPNSLATAMRFRSRLETQLGDTNYHEKLFEDDSKDLLRPHSFLSNREKEKESLASFVSSKESGEENEGDQLSENEVELNHVHIPMVAICVNGGYGTLKQVQEFLRKGVPVLLLAVTNI